MSNATFTHDVFLSHSAKDKAVVRPLAEWLRQDAAILQPSAFSLQPFSCAPLNQERRFIPLRLDDALVFESQVSRLPSYGTDYLALNLRLQPLCACGFNARPISFFS